MHKLPPGWCITSITNAVSIEDIIFQLFQFFQILLFFQLSVFHLLPAVLMVGIDHTIGYAKGGKDFGTYFISLQITALKGESCIIPDKIAGIINRS